MEVIYQRKERVIIKRELEHDYEVLDLDNNLLYLIDKHYFRKQYEAQGEAIHQEVWEHLRKLEVQLHQMRNENSNLKSKLNKERQEKAKIVKERPKKQHYKNGKRGGKFNG